MAKKKTTRATKGTKAGRKTTKKRPAKGTRTTTRADRGPSAESRPAGVRDLGRTALSKLDPMLLLATRRAEGETAAGLMRGEELVPTAEAARAGLRRPSTALGAEPRSVPSLSLGVHSLASQMGPDALNRLVERDLVPVLVDTRDAAELQASVEKWGGAARPVSATSVVAQVPRRRLRDLAEMASVNYVEAGVKLRPHCDLAHVSTGLIDTGMRTVPQRGRGVLVGIVDTGIDAAHPAFQAGGRTRIVRYLDQNNGRQYSSDEIDAGAARSSPDEIGHGTHVAGIAAGNGAGINGNRFAGVATEADLAIVKTTFQSDQIAAGIREIFDIADERNQPCVVNLSLGGHYGGHDGSTVAERAIDQMSGPGRIVVVSAGNEGQDPIHASTVLPVGQSQPARWVADFVLERRTIRDPQEGFVQVGLLYVQVWHQHEDDIAIRLRSPSGENFVAPDQGVEEFDRGVFFVEASHELAPYSGDHVTTFFIAASPANRWLGGWSIIAEEDRASGRQGVRVGPVHAWILDRDMGAFTSGHTRSHLVGMPGTAHSAITVASYATRREWTSIDQNQPHVRLDAVNLEDISYFSSPGPTRDGYNKPEVAAPGQWLVSTLSAQALLEEMPNWLRLPGEKYAALQGTSMSAPYVTGALALLLEKDGSIDWAEAKRRLIKSTRQDAFTTPCWNPRWGYGKIDVRRLLEIEP